MKHLFFAHSHTLVLCSIGTINYLRLNREDCVFLCTRNYKMPSIFKEFKTFDANDVHQEFDAYRYGTFEENRAALRRLDNFIDLWTEGDDFMFYPPHMWGGIFSFTASHPRCKKISFVQEGAHVTESYFVNKISLWLKIKGYLKSIKHFGNLRGYPCNAWYVDGCLGLQRKIDVYCTSKSFFQYMPKDKTIFHIIKWPKYDTELSIEHQDGTIFIFDGYVSQGMVDEDVYKKCCERIIYENHRDYNYVKFHPSQSQEERKWLLDAFIKNDINVEIFPENIPFEYYISSFKNLNIAGFGSSLLYFAIDAGHNVVARTSWLLDSEKFRNEVRNGYTLLDKQI